MEGNLTSLHWCQLPFSYRHYIWHILADPCQVPAVLDVAILGFIHSCASIVPAKVYHFSVPLPLLETLVRVWTKTMSNINEMLALQITVKVARHTVTGTCDYNFH